MMKKCISLLLALVIILTLAACGGVGDVVGRNTPNNTNGAASQVSNAESNESGKDEIISGKSADRVINPSELLEAEDATKIFGKDFESAERDVEAGLQSALLCRYSSWDGVTDLQLGIIIMQDAILDETKSFDKKLIESGGITGYNQNEKGKLSEEGAIPAEGIGEWALMADSSDGKRITFAYGAYNVELQLTVYGGESGNTDDAWIEEKLTEAGKLAAGRLKDIIG
ncbi:MAG TPA: hypothetical protein DEQ02_04330 [Ruminococcaceae bacterium]|nr:hypothetical protein [Oscillospiraceae bacterium]